jgi:hypothetical protein
MYFKDLSKKEKKHLRETGVRTLRQFKAVAVEQAKWRKENPLIEPCWECKRIAQKLGLLAAP